MNTIQTTTVSTHIPSHHAADSVQKTATIEDTPQAGKVKADHAAHSSGQSTTTGIELPRPEVAASAETADQIMSALQPLTTQASSDSTPAAAQILSVIIPASLLEAIQRDGDSLSPETAAELGKFLSQFDLDKLAETLQQYGIELSPEDTARITELLSHVEAPTGDNFYGVPQHVDAVMNALSDLMAMLLQIIQAALKQKTDSAGRAFKASEDAATEQSDRGQSQFIGAMVSGTVSTVVAIGGAYQSGKGHKDEFDAIELRNGPGAGGPGSAQARLQADGIAATGRSRQEWGRMIHTNLSGAASGAVKGGYDAQVATHDSANTVDNAASQVHHSMMEQQTQEVSSGSSMLAKLMDLLSQYRNSQVSAIDTIVSNTRRG